MKSSHILLYGFGYVARALAAHPSLRDWQVTGTTRTGGKSETPNLKLVKFPDGDSPIAGHIQGITHILSSIPPQNGSDPALEDLRAAGSGLNHIRWIGYLSSTAVYGDLGGGWADEETVPGPLQERGIRRRQAEAAWQAFAEQRGAPVHIFRLAGIYGPGRNVLERLKAGRAVRIDQPGHVMCRAHLDDILAVLIASMTTPNPGRIYNVADDCPAPQREVVEFAAAMAGIEPPPLVTLNDPSVSDAMRSFYLSCRRIRNRRIKEELGVKLTYPSYREGLTALFRQLVDQPIED